MLPEEVYEVVAAVNAHFAGKYDFHKYNGKMRSVRLDRAPVVVQHACSKLASQGRDPVMFTASNAARGRTWLPDALASGVDDYLRAESFCQSNLYAFTEDLRALTHDEFDANLRKSGEDYPILKQVRDGSINLETACLLDELTGFLDSAENSVNPLLARDAERCRRYASFLNVPRDGRIAAAVLKIFPLGSRS